jgi:peptide/nickel transport system substrate-binding protein
MVPYMQQAWREVGVEMLPTAIPFPTLIDNLNAGNFQMASLGFSWDVNGDQGDMYRCDAIPPTGFNRMRYCNPEYDELNDQSSRELDNERRIDLLIEQTNIINNDAANGILVFTRDIMGNGPRVHNFLPNGYFNFWSLPYIWVTD